MLYLLEPAYRFFFAGLLPARSAAGGRPRFLSGPLTSSLAPESSAGFSSFEFVFGAAAGSAEEAVVESFDAAAGAAEEAVVETFDAAAGAARE